MLLAIVTIAATVAAVLAIYFATRFVLNPEPDEKTTDLAGKVLIRIAALHGLVLALVFASEVVEYHQLSFESAIETNAVSDAYYDSDRYGAEETVAIRSALRTYLQVASTTEWQLLSEAAKLHPDAWKAWDDAYNATLDLEPQTPREEALRSNILRKIHLVAENRDLREHHAKTSLSSLFWIAALAGILLIAIGFYPFPPKRENLTLLSAYSGYTGLIFFTIYAMSNPYGGPAALQPTFFEAVIMEIEE
jgi:hypothetical protein